MDMVYLYKLEGCEACVKARALLISKGYTIKELFIDNPLLEMASASLYKDNKVHAPLVVIPNKGIYMLNADGTDLLRLVSLCS